MNHEKVKSIVFDILESCDCEDKRVCDKCPFVKLCVGIFTGDWGDIPHEEANPTPRPIPRLPSSGSIGGQMVRKMIEAYEGRVSEKRK